jgi:NADPH:quinone reductase-like Zn-dependent oxidoreductase
VKALVHTRYGTPDVLEMRDVAKPVPADDEMLVRVRAVSVNRSDWEAVTGTPLYARMNGLRKPRRQTPGSDVAGVVEAIGSNHREFQPGDEVFGEMESYSGGFAEYVCTKGKDWARKPPAMTFEAASAIPQAGVIALQGLRDRIRAGQRVLINGAGGGGGTFAIQLAKSFGAEVTAVDLASKFDFMRSLGADHCIDYTVEDFTRGEKRYDLILDLIAYRSLFAYARALAPGGSYYAVGGSLATFLSILLFGPLLRKLTKKSVRVLVVRRNRRDLEAVTELCQSGTLLPVIDRMFPFDEVAEALRQLGAGKINGKAVISVRDAGAVEG